MPSEKTYTLITGASSGFGERFAQVYAQDGRNLILVSRSKDKLESLKESILKEQKDIEIHVVAEDLGQPGSAKRVFDACAEWHASTLILNAGQAIGGLWSGTPLDKVQAIIQLNVTTLVEMAQLFAPGLEKFANANPRSSTTEGGLMTVASQAAFQPMPWMAHYGASKAYVLHFTEAIHEEMKERCPNMRVTCLAPGTADSPICEKNGANKSAVQLTMLTVDQVVADGKKALEKGQAVMIPGWLQWAQTVGGKIAPRALTRVLAAHGMNQSHHSELEMSEEDKKAMGL